MEVKKIISSILIFIISFSIFTPLTYAAETDTIQVSITGTLHYDASTNEINNYRRNKTDYSELKIDTWLRAMAVTEVKKLSVTFGYEIEQGRMRTGTTKVGNDSIRYVEFIANKGITPYDSDVEEYLKKYEIKSLGNASYSTDTGFYEVLILGYSTLREGSNLSVSMTTQTETIKVPLDKIILNNKNSVYNVYYSPKKDTTIEIYQGNSDSKFLPNIFSYRTSDSNIATVDRNGIIKPLNVGQCTITASISTKSVDMVVNVRPEFVSKPTMTQDTYYYTGEEQILKLNKYDSNKMTIYGNSQIDTGNYEAVVKLKDKNNQMWFDSTTDDLIFNWKIIKNDYTLEVKKPIVERKTNKTITLVRVDGYEYSIDGINFQDSNTFENLKPDTEYTLCQRFKETDKINSSSNSENINVRTLIKDDPGVPDKPMLYSKTNTMIQLYYITGYEYSIDGVNFQDSNTFENLNPDTEYTLYQRIKETDTRYASEISDSLVVKTYSDDADMEAPIIDLSTLKVDRKEATLGDTIKISIKVTDQSNINDVCIHYKKPITKTMSNDIHLDYNSENQLFEKTLTIDNSYEAGDWQVYDITATDENWYYTNVNSIRFFEKSGVDLSDGDFNVSGTDADVIFPEIDISSLETNGYYVTTGSNLKLSLKVKDDRGIGRVYIIYKKPNSFSLSNNIYLEYNSNTDKYEGEVIFDNSYDEGVWQIDSITATDSSNNCTNILNFNIYKNSGKDLSKGDFKFLLELPTEINKSNEATGIKISTYSDVVNSNTILSVDKLDKSLETNQNLVEIIDTLPNTTSNTNYEIFDIRLVDEGNNEVQPNGKVTVYLPIPNGFSSKVKVYNIDPANSENPYTLLDTTIETIDNQKYAKFTTNHFSYYSMVNGELTGDVNGDGKVNITDVALVNSHVKKVKILTGDELVRADVNGDGKVNITDVALVNSHVKKVKMLED